MRRLREDVERALLLAETDPDAFARSAGLPADLAASPEARLLPGAPPPAGRQTGADCTGPQGTTTACPEAETARFFVTAPWDVARFLRATLCSLRRCLSRSRGRPVSEGEAAEAVFDHALACWEGIRVARAHRVFARDGWRCTVPGCSSHRNLQDHHVVFRAAGGSDDLANRTTLCAWHHLRGVHEGRVGVSGRAPAGLRFALGLRRAEPPLLRYAPGERIAG